EKVVPSIRDLSTMLRILIRSATGQRISSYVTMVNGPRREGEEDGPEQFHLVIMDNGRSKLLGDVHLRESLNCIRCGACLNACPVYRKVGGHSYGAVYSGPIGAILTPVFKGLANYPDLPNASSLCGACYEACPVKIDIPKYLIQLRNDMVEGGMAKGGERAFMRFWANAVMRKSTYEFGVWSQKLIFRTIARFSGTLEKGDPYTARGWVEKMPGPISGWTSQRSLPTPPARTFRQWWNGERQSEKRGDVTAAGRAGDGHE
ncbi:MAG: DUF3390 domain-containing protein, partial [Rhodospirillales bacterium]|nr:DUF3390 domain-containing protein [Rhodospirillales bacterium]